MPKCENPECAEAELTPEEIHEEVSTKRILCDDCAEGTVVVRIPVKSKSLVLGRELDYQVSYTKREGLRAGVRLGGAQLSLSVDQSELDRTFGPHK